MINISTSGIGDDFRFQSAIVYGRQLAEIEFQSVRLGWNSEKMLNMHILCGRLSFFVGSSAR